MEKTFRDYRLIKQLASKHSHTTYLVTTVKEPNRQLILIVFASWLFHFAHESENLLQKAQCIKELQHPHVAPTLDMGIEEEQPFVVREYLPNGSLRNYIKQTAANRLELADALTIVSQIGEALAYVHERNTVHSNIKPENILFDANGQAVLTDFYLVTKKDTLIRDQTSEEYAFCYLAPEQFANVSDAKSDQYALGCLTYELITGRVPFAAQTLASIMGHQNYTLPAPLSESGVDLPAPLEAAILKTLAKDPAERFFDFSLFLEVIKSTLSPPPNSPPLHSTHVRKNRTPTHSALSANAGTPIRKEESSAFMLETKPELDFPTFELPMATLETHDVWHSDPFNEEETDASLVIVSLPGHKQSESKASKIRSSLPSSANGNKPGIRGILRNRRRRLELILFLSAMLALITYTLWPSALSTPNTDTPLTNSTTHDPRAKSTANPESVLVLAHSETPTAVITPNPTAVITPNLTATPAPSPTATAPNANPYPPYSGTLALSDPLRDNNRGYGWQETPPASSNSGWSCQFIGGAYYAQAQNGIYATCHPDLQASNFTFEVQMQIINGNCSGLTLRDNGHSNAYSFQICRDGSYQFNRLANGFQTLKSGSRAAIATGSNQSNLIALVANGSNFDLYANHQKLTSISDNSYSSGTFGLTANAAYTNARMWIL